MLYKDESYKIIGACYEVYNEMGPGFLEAVYQECLKREFDRHNIPYVEFPRLEISYKEELLDHYYESDFLCYDSIIVEIKAAKALANDNKAQTINYLKATKLKLGLLVNFGSYPDLQYERFVNNKSIREDPRDS